MLAAEECVVVPAHLVGCFGLDDGNFLPASVRVDGDKNEIGAGDVEVRSGLRVFDPHLNTYFDRCVEGAVDAGLENEQVADVHMLDEVDMIHGRGDDVSARMTICGDGTNDVDEVHEATAEEVSEGVGVVGKDDLGHLGLGACNRADGRVGISRAHV